MADSKISQLPTYSGGTNADEIPIANLTTQSTQQVTITALKALVAPAALASNNGLFTHDTETTTTTVIAHGLGKVPALVHFDWTKAGGGYVWVGSGNYSSGASNSSTSIQTAYSSLTSNVYAVLMCASSVQGLGGTVTVDATNITITWSVLPSGTAPGNIHNVVWFAI